MTVTAYWAIDQMGRKQGPLLVTDVAESSSVPGTD